MLTTTNVSFILLWIIAVTKSPNIIFALLMLFLWNGSSKQVTVTLHLKRPKIKNYLKPYVLPTIIVSPLPAKFLVGNVIGISGSDWKGNETCFIFWNATKILLEHPQKIWNQTKMRYIKWELSSWNKKAEKTYAFHLSVFVLTHGALLIIVHSRTQAPTGNFLPSSGENQITRSGKMHSIIIELQESFFLLGSCMCSILNNSLVEIYLNYPRSRSVVTFMEMRYIA